MVWINNARIIAIFAVVVLHVAARIVQEAEVGSGAWWTGNLTESLVRWCVPVFVMISGALLLKNKPDEHLINYYMKRVSRIFIPLIFWSVFYLCWTALKTYLVTGEVPVALLIGRLQSGKPYYHLWFLFMLIGLYIFTPFMRVFVAAARPRDIRLFVVLAFIWALATCLSNAWTSTKILFFNQFLLFIPYFVMGHVAMLCQPPRKIMFWSIFLLSFAGTAVGYYFETVGDCLDSGIYFYQNLSITVVPMSISMFFILKNMTTPLISEVTAKKVADLTFGIYLIHPMVMNLLSAIGLKPLCIHTLIYIPITSILTFLLSLVASLVISKIPFLRRTI